MIPDLTECARQTPQQAWGWQPRRPRFWQDNGCRCGPAAGQRGRPRDRNRRYPDLGRLHCRSGVQQSQPDRYGQSWRYRRLGEKYPHAFVRHYGGEYVIGAVHTNTIEGFWSIFKRGVGGAFHKVSEKIHAALRCQISVPLQQTATTPISSGPQAAETWSLVAVSA